MGTSLGSVADSLYADVILKRQHNFEEIKHKLIEDGLISVVADSATLGLAKALRPLARGLAHANWDKITNYIPGVGWTKNFLAATVKALKTSSATPLPPSNKS